MAKRLLPGEEALEQDAFDPNSFPEVVEVGDEVRVPLGVTA